jgi:lysophospholipase L1-like esterase
MSKRILVFCSIIIGLLLSEGVVRYLRLAPTVFDYKIFEPMIFVENQKICYKMKPFGDCEGGRLNSEGFKDRDHALHKDANTVRIIMLGDSITKGTGINLGNTFSDQLEEMLNQKAKQVGSSLRYEVMNFGVGGYNIVSEIEILKVYSLKYKPDIVILNYFYNDNEEYSYNNWWFMQNSDLTASQKNLIYQYYLASNKFRIKRLLFRSHLFRLSWISINRLFQRQDKINKVKFGNTYKEDIVSDKLSELKQLGERYNFRTVVCMHPFLDYDINEPHLNYNLTEHIAERLDFMCIDLRLFYKYESNDPAVFLQNSEDKGHPNKLGHFLVAKSILSELERNHFVEF